MRLLYWSIFMTIVALNLSTQVQGAMIQGVTIKDFSSEYVAAPDMRRARSVVSESGFFGDYHTTSPRGSMWLSFPVAAGSFTNAFITFDLGSVQPIHQMKVWNYNEGGVNTGRGLQRADIQVAGEDLVFTTQLANQNFTKAPGTFANNFAQSINMTGVLARYVRINVLTNYGGASDGRVGLSKVRFINTNVPPTVKLVTKSYAGNRVTVKFSEPVQPSTATNTANYSIQSGATIVPILSAAMDSFSDRVVLQAGSLDTNLSYTLTAQNVFEASGTTSITNTTVNIAPEFVLWLKADAGVTSDGNGYVSQWNDQSGAGNNAAEADPNLEPTLVNGAINGKPAVHFDGGNDGLASPHNPSLIVEGDLSFFAVIRPTSLTVHHGILSKCGGAASLSNSNFPATLDMELVLTTGKPRLLRGNGTALSTMNGNANAVAGQTFIVEIIVKGTNALHYLNGNFNGQAVFADGVEDLGNPLRIGRRESQELFVNGDIAEILLMRGAVTESERLDIDTYLGRKYAIVTPTTGAPVITSQPTDVLTYVGNSATFSVGLTNGAVPRTNQWFKSPNILLAGQTNLSLVLSNLTLADNGTSYYLISSNQDGSTQTTNANLTVLPLTPPFFTQLPQPQSIYIHQRTTFTTAALGSPNLNYQWYFNGVLIEGATNTSLTVANVTTNNAGNYSVTVSNEYPPSTNSGPAALTVIVPPTGTYPAAILAANPLVYFRFSEINETNIAMNYGNLGSTHNATNIGTFTPGLGPQPPTFPFETDNPAYKDETLTAGGAFFPAINLTTNSGPRFTFACWAYKDVLQGSFASVFYCRGGTATSCGLGVKLVSGQDMLEYQWNDTQSGYNSGLIVPSGQWNFLAMTVEPTRTILYMNAGAGLQSATNAVAHAVRPQLAAGYISWDSFAAARRWYGTIDEAMFFDRALSATEIDALYSGIPMIPAPSVQLNITRSGSNLVLNWSSGTLQRADAVSGTYSDMIGITSPYTVSPTGSGKFYRVRQ